MAGDVVVAGGAGDSGNIWPGWRFAGRHGLYDRPGARTDGGMARSGTAGAAVGGDSVLLGEPSEEVAELDARSDFRGDGDVAGAGIVDEEVICDCTGFVKTNSHPCRGCKG